VTDVIPQERAKQSGGTLRESDIGCTDARAPAQQGAPVLSSTASTE